MALVIRFVDQNSEVREKFVDFLECDSGAENLVQKISKAIESVSLDMKDLRGQAYDGAGNMAVEKSGVSTRIRFLYSKALYFHCASHRLNLAVASSINICGVNMMDSIRQCSEIFHFSRKKTQVFKEKIEKLMPDMRTILLDVCKTRWLLRIDGLERVHEMMLSILETHDMIPTNYDRSYKKDARSDAYWTFKSFQFVWCI